MIAHSPTQRHATLAAMPVPAILEINDLQRSFGHVHAVRGVSFAVQAGECYGLLGPNGAGKTTTIELMEGILTPDAGQVRYRGERLGAQFRAEAGIQFQSTALQDYLTVREQLTLFRNMYADGRDIDDLLAVCALESLAGRDARKLSGGQRQRMLLAIALVNRPRIVFMDEPTTGLDPQARRNFWDLVRTIKAEGTTVLLTTHYMDEAYQLCDRIGIMDHGRIIAEGTPADLLYSHFGDRVLLLPKADLAAAELDIDWQPLGEHGEILTNDLEATLDALRAAEVPLAELQVRERTLEDLFLHLTGSELRA